jgi:L-threonylcarbamoyladenylate synthase
VSVRIVPAERPGAIAEAVAALRRGELCAVPTETVYGLAALATDEAAIARVFAAKGRPRTHPLIVHVAGIEDARRHAGEWSARAQTLAAAFWPGPLTIVVPKAASVPAIVTGGGDSVALRAPRHPVARALLALLHEGFVAPSANRYQSTSPTSAEHVARAFADREEPLLILDGGPSTEGLESTVVDVRGERAIVLRPGTITVNALAAALGEDVERFAGAAREDAVRAAPGMDRRHYAPRARVLLAGSHAEAVERAGALQGAVRVSFGPSAGAVALPADAAGAGRELYALLHRLDEDGAPVVVFEPVPPGEPWDALRDRLGRAAG